MCLADGAFAAKIDLRCEPLKCSLQLSNGSITYTKMPDAIFQCDTGFTMVDGLSPADVDLDKTSLETMKGFYNVTFLTNLTTPNSCLGSHWQRKLMCIPQLPRDISRIRSFMEKICPVERQFSDSLSDNQYFHTCGKNIFGRLHLPFKFSVSACVWIISITAISIALLCLCIRCWVYLCRPKQKKAAEKVEVVMSPS